MSENNEEAVERINNAVDDGSGCSETWEALTEIRNKENSTGRRRLLKSLGVIGSATLLFTGGGAASTSSEDSVETTVEELSGERRDQTIEDAWDSSKVESIVNEFSPDETANTEQASAVVSSYGDDQYRTVMIPFETEDESLTITWTDNEKLEPIGRRTIHQEEESGTKVEVTAYYIENEIVKTETNVIDFDEEAKSESEITASADSEVQPAVTPGVCGPTAILDFDCAGEVIYIYAEEISACATCAASGYTTGLNPLTYTACGSCLGLYLKEVSRTGRPCQLCNSITLG